MIAAGADVNLVQLSGGGTTPLFLAASRGRETMVRILIDAGANVNCAPTAKGNTPVGIASSRGHEAVVLMLIGAGATPVLSATSKSSDTPPTTAVPIFITSLLNVRYETRPPNHIYLLIRTSSRGRGICVRVIGLKFRPSHSIPKILSRLSQIEIVINTTFRPGVFLPIPRVSRIFHTVAARGFTDGISVFLESVYFQNRVSANASIGLHNSRDR